MARAHKSHGASGPPDVRDWPEVQQMMSRPLYEAVLAAVQVRPGMRLLDAGCGTGLAAQLAAQRGAAVTGVDLAANVLVRARARVPEGSFEVADYAALPYEDGAFDAVVTFNSLQFALDPVAALRELRRVVRPDGPVAIAVWDAPERCDSAATLRAADALLPPGSEPGDPFALSAPGRIEDLMGRAGLRQVDRGEVLCPWGYPDAEAAWRALSGGSRGSVVRAVEAVGAEVTRRAVLDSLRPFRLPDGSYCQNNVFRYVLGRE